jgi:cation diffusion facilitator CzcD-associated flavoprotein CzcO
MAIPQDQKPVLIVGAGISGLLLAQSLTQHKIPVRVFERDANLETRGVGWGLTLNWSLPALQSLLPEHLYSRLPEAYVDREAIKGGLSSRFPFFDLATGELKASTPTAPEASRIRVTRQGLRNILASGINVEVSYGSQYRTRVLMWFL